MKLYLWSFLLPIAVFIFNRVINSKLKNTHPGLALKREVLGVIDGVSIADGSFACSRVKKYFNKMSYLCNDEERDLNNHRE